MVDKQTEVKINEAVTLEFVNAVQTYGAKYNSLHEAYAVLKEEVEEADDDFDFIKDYLNSLWTEVKGNDKKAVKESAYMIAYNAIELAKEAVQIAAVAKKIIGE
jgi:hypothetical protein